MASIASSSSFLSGNSINYHHETASQESELLKRPVDLTDLPGQAAFLSLLKKLHVPILNKTTNSEVIAQHHYFVGAGRSYSVTEPLVPLGSGHSEDIDVDRNFDETFRSTRYVTKRIIPLPSHLASDRIQLAAITNEIRIMANKTLKEEGHIVKLLGVAWDEVPTFDRHWPRLLLEAADYGNFAEFIATHNESQKWDVKLELLLNILQGIKMLHFHQVTHCDLKLENVLIFRAHEDREHPFGVKYQAKICDFGFSVVMSDYEDGSIFSATLGTEPWNAPELTFGTPIAIEHLPMADVYSFALLFSRVMMHGGNPFTGLEKADIRRLKQDTSLAMFERVSSSIFNRVDYTEAQQLAIKKLLLVTLSNKPDERFPILAFGLELSFLGIAFRE